jgi:hypothetical protein
MTEREMLELAAKALDDVNIIDEGDMFVRHCGCNHENDFCTTTIWNPLRYAADCAEMEARLMLNIRWYTDAVCSEKWEVSFHEYFKDHDNDRQRARMMASTRAAAALGESQNGN